MENKIFSVNEFNNFLKNIIDESYIFKNLNIKGQIKNFKKYNTNYFFQLIDDESSLSCFASVTYNELSDKFSQIKEGDLVQIKGSLTIFNKKGTYNIFVRDISFVDEGLILLEKKKLIDKLRKNNIIKDKKRPLKIFPSKIGIICGDNSAAYFDLIKNISNRYKNIEIYFFPTTVQGQNAKKSILKSLSIINNYNLDALILSRGGGDDLKVFDDEEVAIEFSKANCPTISAIGHEIDFSVCDYIADLRVSTPTAAAMAVVPDLNELVQNNKEILNTLKSNIIFKVNNFKLKLSNLNEIILKNNKNSYIKTKLEILNNVKIKLIHNLKNKLNYYQNYINILNEKVINNSPINILNKGYSLIFDSSDILLKKKSDIKKENILKIITYDGSVKIKKENIYDN